VVAVVEEANYKCCSVGGGGHYRGGSGGGGGHFRGGSGCDVFSYRSAAVVVENLTEMIAVVM
jgi:hypothetical protein